jgi:purine-binding chemotaxis protein CheW
MVKNKRENVIDREDDIYLEEEEDSMKNLYLTFRVGEEDFGIEIVYVTEIVGMQNITEVPDMPSFVKGVINLRGQVIPVIDVRLRFKLESRKYDDRTCVIVVNVKDTVIGLIVDTVSEVINIPEEQISPPPKVNRSEARRYIHGMGKVDDEVKILLDVEKLFWESEMEAMTASAE